MLIGVGKFDLSQHRKRLGPPRRQVEAERLSGLEVDRCLVPGRHLHRKAGRFGAAQDAIDARGCLPILLDNVGAYNPARVGCDAFRSDAALYGWSMIVLSMSRRSTVIQRLETSTMPWRCQLRKQRFTFSRVALIMLASSVCESDSFACAPGRLCLADR